MAVKKSTAKFDSARRDVTVTLTAAYELRWTEPEYAVSLALQKLQQDVRRGTLHLTSAVRVHPKGK